MIVLALDTATPATVVAVQVRSGACFEARDDPPAGERPDHAARLLALAEESLARAGATWDDLDRIAVGVGPGGFTGLRIGVATARALAQSHGTPLVPVSTLRALAEAARDTAGERPALAVIDARRGEAFAAAWSAAGECELEPAAHSPTALAGLVPELSGRPLAVGDGAVRFRSVLEEAGVEVPPDESALHRVSGAALCRLGAAGAAIARDLLLPDYRREPDAKPPRLP